MGKQFRQLESTHIAFVERQKIFFNASAAADGRVNVSPRDGKSLRVLDANTVAYVDLTGSGNETAAHLLSNSRLTLMFCSFEGPPMILRLYGRGRVVRRGSAEYASFVESRFEGQEIAGARQTVVLEIDLVQTSCGFNVPLFDYVGERDTLLRWAENKGGEGLEQYWREKNAFSIDGFATGLIEDPSSVDIPGGSLKARPSGPDASGEPFGFGLELQPQRAPQDTGSLTAACENHSAGNDAEPL